MNDSIGAFGARLHVEYMAGVLDVAAKAAREDADSIETGATLPYPPEILVKLLRDLDKALTHAAECMRFALDNPNV